MLHAGRLFILRFVHGDGHVHDDASLIAPPEAEIDFLFPGSEGYELVYERVEQSKERFLVDGNDDVLLYLVEHGDLPHLRVGLHDVQQFVGDLAYMDERDFARRRFGNSLIIVQDLQNLIDSGDVIFLEETGEAGDLGGIGLSLHCVQKRIHSCKDRGLFAYLTILP